MPFFTYNQNNSGGGFDVDEERGISHFVIIEADDAIQADDRAQEIGLYFDGVDSGADCGCCGDRWYEAWLHDGKPVPTVYDIPIQDVVFTDKWSDEPNHVTRWIKSAPEAYVHFADGKVQAYGLPAKAL